MTAPLDEAGAERVLLLAYIRAARSALAELGPNRLRTEYLGSAANEIGMIVETAESAANQIMDAADQILNLSDETEPDMYRAFVQEKCLAMLSACAFQDLTGQRSNKVIETLMHIEDKLGKLAALVGDDEEAQPADREERVGDDVLLNGPSMPGEGVDQDEIDAMFA